MSRKYIVSWYEQKLIVTNCCKTFTNRKKAIDYYTLLKQRKTSDFGRKITRVTFSEEVLL